MVDFSRYIRTFADELRPVSDAEDGIHYVRDLGAGWEFDSLREYQVGDEPRQIDWKASAHSRQKLVRVFTQETDRPTVLLVDQRRSLFFGSRERTKSVTAAQVILATSANVVRRW